MINTVLKLNNQILELVGGYENFCLGGETLDDGGGDGDLDRSPGLGRVRILSPGSVALVDER